MPNKQKVSVEEKIKNVRTYLAGEIGIGEAARRCKVDEETVAGWVRNYETDGIDAFLSQKNRVYSPQIKHEAVQEYISGKGSLADICKRYKIRDKKTLREWMKVLLMEISIPGNIREAEAT